MQKIISPLTSDSTGPLVAALHAALTVLLRAPPVAEVRSQTYGAGTRRLIETAQRQAGLDTTGNVDARTADMINSLLAEKGLLDDQEPDTDPVPRPKPRALRLSGRVSGADGKGIAAKVAIFTVAFRKDEPLETLATDKEGHWQIELSAPVTPPNLRVRAAPRAGDTLTSPVIYKASGDVLINLTAATRDIAAQSSFEGVEGSLRPVLGDVLLADLREVEGQSDLTFLARDRGVPLAELARVTMAERLGRGRKIDPAVIFAFLVQNEPSSLPGDILAATPTLAAMDEVDMAVLAGIVAMPEASQRAILTQAAARDLVPQSVMAGMEDSLAALRALRPAVLADLPFGPGKTTLDGLLGASSLSAKQRGQVIALHLEAQEKRLPLWALIEAADIPAAKVADLRATMALGSFAKSHLPFVTYAKKALPAEILAAPGRAAALTRKDWESLIRKGLSEGADVIPANIEAVDDESRIATFAEMLMERAEISYPVMATLGRMAERADLDTARSDEVFKAVFEVPDMNLRTLNIAAVRLGRTPDAATDDRPADPTLTATLAVVKGMSEPGVEVLRRVQRAIRLAPGAQAAAALLVTGHDAAHRIQHRGRGNFLADAKEAGMTDLQAGATFDHAQATYAYLLARFLEFRADLHSATPAAVGGNWSTLSLVAEMDAEPSLRTLFGSLDACACDWCESVHGPAAYYTDVLRWLGQRGARPGSGFATARDVLAARRGDLLDIVLDCPNTETVLPYIDLVNEVLEHAVSPGATLRQTTWRSEELLAEPEHVNAGAYTLLAAARHAPGLPFDLPHAEAQTWLAHLRLTRAEVMQAFQIPANPPQPEAPSDFAIAAAHFGLSQTSAEIIATPAPTQQAMFWSITTPADFFPVAKVNLLLARADLSYTELSDVLFTGFVNDAAPLSVFQPEFECDLFEREVTALTPERLDRMNRFVRLWRQLGWKVWEVDLAIFAVGGVLDRAGLVALMRLDQMRTRLKLRVEEACALFSSLDVRVRDGLTGDGRAFYPDLFQNRAVQNPPDVALSVASVTAAVPTAALGAKAATIASALSLTAEDLALLMPVLADPKVALPVAGGVASLASLSQIWRMARLARALRMPVADLLAYCRMVDAPLNPAGRIDPFLTPFGLTRFLRGLDVQTAAKVSVPEARHIVTAWAETPFGATDATLGLRIEEFRTLLADLRIETDVPTQERAAALERQLASVAGFEAAAVRATTLEIINDSFTGTPAARTAFITANFAALMPVPAALVAFAPYAGAVAGRVAAISARQAVALQAIYRVLARAGIIATLAAQTGLEAEAAAYLAFVLVRPGLLPLGDQLLAPAFLQRLADDSGYALAATRSAMPATYTLAALIDKIAFAAQTLGMDTARLLWVVRQGGSFGLPVLGALPLAAANPQMPAEQWQTLLRWTAVFAAVPGVPGQTLPEILLRIGTAGYAMANLQADLALAFQRPLDSITGTLTALGLGAPADMLGVVAYERLIAAQAVLRLAGVPPAQMAAWAGPQITPVMASEMKLGAKARHQTDDWLKIAPPLQDRLREAKRLALVTYLTSRPAPAGTSWPDANALFAHFLIDPEMSACRKTSRLVQATGSVQLFVQRCLMNLEPAVLANAETDEDWLHWEWMSAYRLWEAARKVFLWPENVIRPELNTMKSPLLLDLEQKLAQGELTSDMAEEAVGGYLETLEGIGNLDVIAMHEEQGASDRKIHVLARTKGEPAVYHYRQQIFPHDATQAYWTAWAKVDLDMPEGGSVPIFGFVNRKLHLFWLMFTAKPNPTQKTPPSQASSSPPPDAQKMWEIQLCWSVLRHGRFGPPALGRRKLVYTEFRPVYAFHLKTAVYGGERLAINIFVSTAAEFNDRSLRLWNGSGFSMVEQDPSTWYHSEDTRPIHIARFVFRRDVEQVQLTNRNLLADLLRGGLISEHGASTQYLTSPLADLVQPQAMHHAEQSIVNNTYNSTILNVVPSGGWVNRIDNGQLLTAAPAPFRILAPAQRAQFASDLPFFFSEPERTFFVHPSQEWLVDGSFTTVEPSLSSQMPYRVRYVFDRFYHPFTGFLLDRLAARGLRGLYARSTQLSPPGGFAFASYAPRPLVSSDSPTDIIDFSYGGAYAAYNWEVFFHVPFLIATRLAEAQRYDEALAWMHRVFDPTNAAAEAAPQRYWITKPFFQMTATDYADQQVNRLLELVNAGSASHVAQVEAWRDDPFDPHLLARLRPVAYQRAVVMAYIGMLLDWGDQEFRRFSTESLNLATQYYIRASDLLGRRPETVPVDRRITGRTFRQVEADLDAFGNLLSEVENLLPPPPPGGAGGAAPLPPTSIFYFCIPGNAQLLSYWDRVERNLFNLRHCRDLSGVERPLPLFSPPIDPAMLVRAAAAGIDLSTLAGGAAAALPHYRFRPVLARAYAFASEVERLGAALLSALERRDAAALEDLRATQARELRAEMRKTAVLRIDEAKAQIDRLKAALALAVYRYEYNKKKKDVFASVAEGIGLGLKGVSLALSTTSAVLKAVSGGLHWIPDFQVGAAGVGGSPTAIVKAGGHQAAESVNKGADGFKVLAELADKGGELSFKIGYMQERMDKYDHEYEVADRQKAEIEKQITAAEIRVQIAEAELRSEDKQVDHADQIHQFLKTRWTNRELFDWLSGQLSGLYFQAYQTAFDMGLAAGTCAEREVGLRATDYVRFGYWDSVRKGLLAGERLSQDLRRMEAAYMDRDRRRYEVSKDISVAMLDAGALLALRSTGRCEVNLPEALFDGDYPGHYKRRIKTVAITVPSAAGPYASVNCTLTLLSDETRLTSDIGAGYARTGPEDIRFADNLAAIRAIVTSKAQSDSGMFEMALNDDRYLPFEGAGAVGLWRIDLPADTNAFDLDQVSDVILHLHYTAEEGGETLAEAARDTASQIPVRPGAHLMRVDQMVASGWPGLTTAPLPAQDQRLVVPFGRARLPYLDRQRDVTVSSVILTALDAPGNLEAELVAPGGVTTVVTLASDATLGNRISGDTGGAFAAGVALGDFSLRVRRAGAPDWRSLTAADLPGLYAIFVTAAELP